MKGFVVIDTNLLVLLIVGSTDRTLIGRHRRCQDFDETDFELLLQRVSEFSEIVLLPQIVAETSNLIREKGNLHLMRVSDKFRTLVETTSEVQLDSRLGVRRDEFLALGVTDSVILHLCSVGLSGLPVSLLTNDGPLLNAAAAQGLSVVDLYKGQGPH